MENGGFGREEPGEAALSGTGKGRSLGPALRSTVDDESEGSTAKAPVFCLMWRPDKDEPGEVR